MDWFAAAPSVVVLLVLLFGPGLAIGWGLRLRGVLLWGVAPVASTAALALSAVALGLVGVRWSLLSVTVCVALLALLSWVVGLGFKRVRPLPTSGSRGLRRLITVGVLIGAVVGAVRMGVFIGDPTNLSQTNDAVFHLNAIRFIVDTGSASSLDLTHMVGSKAFYPAAWHAFASLAVQVTGASPVVVANALSLVLCGPVWAMSIALLTWVATRGSIASSAFAGALAPWLLAAPFLTLKWGVLYAYTMSLAIFPSVCAVAVLVVWRLIADTEERSRRLGTVQGAILIFIGALALALAQPAFIVAWLIVILAGAIWGVAEVWKLVDRPTRGKLIAGVSVLVVAAIVVTLLLTRSTSGSHWKPPRSRPEAIVDILLNSHVGLPVAPLISILAIVGLVVSVMRPHLRWLATTWIAYSAIYFVAATVGRQGIRTALLGAWYGDPNRLAALLPVVVIPLAAIGLATIVTWAARRIRPSARDEQPIAWTLVALACLGAITVAASALGYDARNPNPYAMSAESYLSRDEAALIARLPGVVGEARVVTNPSTGGALAYALAGTDVYPRTWAMPGSADFALLERSLNDAAHQPAVCRALSHLGAEYVLDFGLGSSTPGRWVMPGMTGFEGREGFVLVDREGDARLWRITACT